MIFTVKQFKLLKRRKNIIFIILFVITAVVLVVYFSNKKNNTKVDEFTNGNGNGNWNDNVSNSVAIMCLIKNPKNIEDWLNYHRKKGITKFYIRLEDTPEMHNFFKMQDDIDLTIGSSSDKTQSSEYDSLFSRQREFGKIAIEKCLKDDIKWLIHVDADELVDCEGSIQSALENEIGDNDNIHVIVMDNYEAKYDKIQEKSDNCFRYKELINCKNGGCTSYANGKSIGRISKHLNENGAHRFIYVGDSDNKNWELNSKKIRVLHFESCDFEQYVSKYISLAKKEKTKEYPFEFYNKSIQLAQSEICSNEMTQDCLDQYKNLYTQYKVSK